MSEKTLVARFQEKVGDADTILAAAAFERRGQAGGLTAGSMLGSSMGDVVGGEVGDIVGGFVGAAVGMKRGMDAGGFGEHQEGALMPVPISTTVGASATRIYAYTYAIKGGHFWPTTPVFEFDRADVIVEVHARASVHTFEVKHVPTNTRYEFEAGRINSHLKDLMAVLNDVDAPAAS